jgi:hypothetical protein
MTGRSKVWNASFFAASVTVRITFTDFSANSAGTAHVTAPPSTFIPFGPAVSSTFTPPADECTVGVYRNGCPATAGGGVLAATRYDPPSAFSAFPRSIRRRTTRVLSAVTAANTPAATENWNRVRGKRGGTGVRDIRNSLPWGFAPAASGISNRHTFCPPVVNSVTPFDQTTK